MQSLSGGLVDLQCFARQIVSISQTATFTSTRGCNWHVQHFRSGLITAFRRHTQIGSEPARLGVTNCNVAIPDICSVYIILATSIVDVFILNLVQTIRLQ